MTSGRGSFEKHRNISFFSLKVLKKLCMLNFKLSGKIGWLVGFYGISTALCYLMPNHVYKYVIYMICNHIFSRWHFTSQGSFVSTQLNDSKYYNLPLVVLFDISILFVHKKVVAISNHTWAYIFDRRPILFRMFNIFLGSIFSNRSFMRLML